MSPPAPLRVGLVSHSGGEHGAERAFVEMARALHGRGVACVVVVPEAGYVETELRAAGVDCTVVQYHWWAMPASLLRRAGRAAANVAVSAILARHFRSRAVDVVLTNTSVIPAGALAARALDVPHLWYICELIGEGWVPFDFGPRRTLRFIDRWSDHVVVASEMLRARMAESISSPDRLHVIPPVFEAPPGVPCEASPPSTVRKRPRAVIVGRLGEGKGQLDAVRAVGHLAEAGLHIDLQIIGAGSPSYTESLRREAAEMGTTEQVQLLGHVDDRTRWASVAAADVVLVCSRDETFGRVTLEAMTLRRAIVASDIPATAELIDHGATGHLYPPGDARALAREIQSVLNGPERGRALGEDAGSWVDANFSPPKNAERLHALLNRASRRSLA